MSHGLNLERIDVLILARLSGPLKKLPGPATVRNDLARFVQKRLTPAEWQTLFQERVAALRERGDLAAKPPLAVTDQGRDRVKQALGGTQVPPWRQLRSTFLPALALELPPALPKVRERLRDAEGLRASILRQAYDLPGGTAPTLTQAVDALTWQSIGIDTDKPLKNLNHLRARVLERLFDGASPTGVEQIISLLAARATGAPRRDPDALRDALVQRWIDRAPDSAESPAEGPELAASDDVQTVAEPPESTADQTTTDQTTTDQATTDQATTDQAATDKTATDKTATDKTTTDQAATDQAATDKTTTDQAATDQAAKDNLALAARETGPTITGELAVIGPNTPPAPLITAFEPRRFDLAEFARMVQRVADSEQDGRFGDRKVFISAIWRRARHDAMCAGITLDGFKQRLIDANRENLLALHRADLVSVMNPDAVRESETVYGNATFHFVASEPGGRT